MGAVTWLEVETILARSDISGTSEVAPTSSRAVVANGPAEAAMLFYVRIRVVSGRITSVHPYY